MNMDIFILVLVDRIVTKAVVDDISTARILQKIARIPVYNDFLIFPLKSSEMTFYAIHNNEYQTLFQHMRK